MESRWAEAEMKGAVVWDLRCRKSLATIVARLTQQPEVSFSHACGPAARQAAHRIFEHPSSTPEGLLHLAVWARDPEQQGQKQARKQRPTREKESQKWLDGLAGTEAVLPPEQPVLVVADREADVFAYLAAPRRPNTDLLVRACQPRLVTVARPGAAGGEERASLLVVAKSAPVVGFMPVR